MDQIVIGIFPLPGLVLFPRTILPLHIFEPRYVRLIRDALDADARIGAANLKTGWEDDYFGAPPIHRVFTIARILHHDELEDDRYNIIIEGVQRAEFVEEMEPTGYRRIRANPLVELMGPEERAELTELRQEMLGLAEELGREESEFAKVLANLENVHRHPGIIADFLASLLVKDAYERQSFLAERRVLRRVELVNVQLRRRLAALRNPSSGIIED